MPAHLRVDPDLAAALTDVGLGRDDGGAGLVFAPRDGIDGWEMVREELAAAFVLTRDAVRRGTPIVYVVHHDDLLGRRGAERAMIGAGLLSAARAIALETKKAGIPINVLARTDGTSRATAATWIRRLLEEPPDGVTGEVIRLGGDHIGKALP